MIEPRIPLTTVTNPRESRALLLAAAARGPTVIDKATETIYVLHYREIERLRGVAAARVAERLACVREAGGGDLVAAFAGGPMHVRGWLPVVA